MAESSVAARIKDARLQDAVAFLTSISPDIRTDRAEPGSIAMSGSVAGARLTAVVSEVVDGSIEIRINSEFVLWGSSEELGRALHHSLRQTVICQPVGPHASGVMLVLDDSGESLQAVFNDSVLAYVQGCGIEGVLRFLRAFISGTRVQYREPAFAIVSGVVDGYAMESVITVMPENFVELSIDPSLAPWKTAEELGRAVHRFLGCTVMCIPDMPHGPGIMLMLDENGEHLVDEDAT